MTLGDAYPQEQARIRQCIENGREIGPAGMFYVAMAEDLLRRADRAAISGDVVEMVRLFKEMQEFQS
jgi:hypothetical protein